MSEEIMRLKQQRETALEIQKQRLEELLPQLMKASGLDMWLVICREDNDDPVLPSLLPAVLSADCSTVLPPTAETIMLVFYLCPDGSMERLALSSLDPGPLYQRPWDMEEDQWQALAGLVKERNPERIGINSSELFAHADGLSHTLRLKLEQALDDQFRSRLTSAEALAVSWLETRTVRELELYPRLIQAAHEIIAEAFSSRVTTPGQTQIPDIGWWMRQKIRDLGMQAWFHPMIQVRRQGVRHPLDSGPVVAGDMLFCDLGLRWLGLNSDTQQLAYVLHPGETEAPQGLRRGMALANGVQDMMTEKISVGVAGNVILDSVRKQAQPQGIECYISTHPIGSFGHGPGPAIGVWNRQKGVPGRGDYAVKDNTCYALELCVVCPVEQWDGQRIVFNLEETIAVAHGKVKYLNGRQTAFHLI